MLSLAVLTFLICSLGSTDGKTEEPLELIMDVDAGADDAMAILIALSKTNKNVSIKAITCVNGNTGVNNVSINVLKTLQVADYLNIPIYKGSDQGLVYGIEMDYYFGFDGFGDFDYPIPSNTSSLHTKHAALALVGIVKKHPGKITVLTTGPLTNIALALHLYPNFLKKVKEFVFVGGSYQGNGNVRPGVEFNVFGDPEAAAYVFSKAPSSKPITMIPMDTVAKAAVPKEWRVDVLGKLPSVSMKFLNKAEEIELSKVGRMWNYWDPIGVMYLLDPSIVKNAMTRSVLVSTAHGVSRGAMFVDHETEEGGIRIITDINKERTKEMLLRKLE